MIRRSLHWRSPSEFEARLLQAPHGVLDRLSNCAFVREDLLKVREHDPNPAIALLASVDGVAELRCHDRSSPKLARINSVRPVRQSGVQPRHAIPQCRVTAVASKSRIPGAGSTLRSRPERKPAAADPRSAAKPARRTCQDRSPFVPGLVEFGQNLVLAGNRSRPGRRPQAGQRQRGEHAWAGPIPLQHCHDQSPRPSHRMPRAGRIRSTCCSGP